MAIGLSIAGGGCGVPAQMGIDGGNDSGYLESPCARAPLFDRLPLDLGRVLGIVPLGNLNPPGHVFPSDHLSMYFEIPGKAVTDPVMVSAPGDLHASSVYSYQALDANDNAVQSDYKIVFDSMKQAGVGFYFDHLNQLAANVAARVGTFANSDCQDAGSAMGNLHSRSCHKALDFLLGAGDEIGSAGGLAEDPALDVGAFDQNSVLPFISPMRYPQETGHSICPLDLFAPALCSALHAKVGTFDGSAQRTAAPLCGRISWDDSGGASGNWFKQGTPDYPEDPHLSLVGDSVDPAIPAISVGSGIHGVGDAVYSFSPEAAGSVNRAFAELRAGSDLYCYQGLDEVAKVAGPPVRGVFVVRMPDARTLWVEKQSGGIGGDCDNDGLPLAFTGQKAVFGR